MFEEQQISSGLSVIHCADGIAVATLGPVCVVLWRGAVVAWRFELQRKGLAETVRLHPGKAVLLCVIEPTAAPPNAEFRRASADMLIGHGEDLRCVCSVIEAQGFRASVIRSVLAGMSHLVGRKELRKAFVANMDDAIEFLKPDVSPATLRRLAPAIAELRTTLAPAAEPFIVAQD